MSSTAADIKTCGVCKGNVSTGIGQAMFTSECSHTFHFGCINNNFANGNHFCPVCQSKWNNLPINMIPFNPPFQFIPHHPTPQFSTFNHFPQPHSPAFNHEPLEYIDDEPLPADNDPTSSSDSLSTLQKVTIKAFPECPALASSESSSQFTVLVRLKAPSLSDDARLSQRAPIDLVTVLDVSGSMSGPKLALLKRAVYFVIDNLGPSDRLSIVSFSDQAMRVLALRRMTDEGRVEARRAVDLLVAGGGTNIVEGLKKGVRVLEERRHKNPVTSVIFLSDGNDTYNHHNWSSTLRRAPEYLHLLPAAIFPKNRGHENMELSRTIPVHSFGFGSDHDPVTMHAIADASGGTFSFIQSYEMVQDAFAGCIGGLLSVVTQELRVTIRSASHGVEIKSISSGRYPSGISNQGSQGLINIGDLYADEEKDFLIHLSIPSISNEKDDKTSLLDITCSYKDIVSKEVVEIEGDLVEIKRPKTLSPEDTVVNLDVDRQRNRVFTAESIEQAQKMAEAGKLNEARELLANRRIHVMGSASARAGDGLCMWLENDMMETEKRMENLRIYEQQGRAYALSGMSSHAMQRATTKGEFVAGAAPQALFGAAAATFGSASAATFGGASAVTFGSAGLSFGGSAAPAPPGAFMGSSSPFAGAYVTPKMAKMVQKSQQQVNNKKTNEENAPMEE